MFLTAPNMWKKGFRGRGKENHVIGHPVLIETTYDTRLLKKAHDRHDSASGNNPISNNNNNNNNNNLYLNPNNHLYPNPNQPTNRARQPLHLRPTSNAPSSVYSQPTPNVPYEHWPPQGLGLSYHEYDVSPIEENDDPFDGWSNAGRPPTERTERTDPFDEWSNSAPRTGRTERSDPFDGWSNAGRPPTIDDDDHDRDPKSRFSWTTRATDPISCQKTPSTYYGYSPPPSPPSEIAEEHTAQYAIARQSANLIFTPPAASIAGHLLTRRDRAASQSTASFSTISTALPSRKPVPAPLPMQTINPPKRDNPAPDAPSRSGNTTPTPTNNTRLRAFTANAAITPTTPKPSTPRSFSTTETNKDLPAPPSLDNPDTDHMTKLTLQLDDLTLRRANISRVVKDLTDETSTLNNPLLTDLKTRRENERRLKALEQELSEIGRQEHELGMKLHRARKRVEREEGYDHGTATLWIRRVTD